MYKLWPGQAKYMTILIFIWPLWPSTYLKNCFKWHFSPSRTTAVQQLFFKSMHKRRSYCPNKLNIWSFCPLFDPYDLDLQPTWKNVSKALLLLEDNNCAKLFLKSMHKCISYGLDKLNIWPFWPLFDPCVLDLQPTWQNVSNGTSPPRGQ